MVIRLGGKDIYLTHKPENFNPKFDLNLVGHVHEEWRVKKENNGRNILVNVGVDVWGFKPISIQEILREIK